MHIVHHSPSYGVFFNYYCNNIWRLWSGSGLAAPKLWETQPFCLVENETPQDSSRKGRGNGDMLLASGAGRQPGCCGIVQWARVQPGEGPQHEAAAENKTFSRVCFHTRGPAEWSQSAAGQARDTSPALWPQLIHLLQVLQAGGAWEGQEGWPFLLGRHGSITWCLRSRPSMKKGTSLPPKKAQNPKEKIEHPA